MARVLVAFGTNDGQTEKIAWFLAELLRGEHHAVELVDVRQPIPGGGLAPFDAAILAGSVRMGKFQKRLVQFVRLRRILLQRVPTVFLPVSLAAMRDLPSAKREVAKTLAWFKSQTGFEAKETIPIAGALQYSKYGFFLKRMMRFISKMAGGDTDMTRDYEYTDWNALSLFGHRFSAQLGVATHVPPPPPREILKPVVRA